MDWMLMPLRRYADFEGRSQRKEFWMFELGIILVALVFGFIYGLLGGTRSTGPSGLSMVILVIGMLGALALLVPAIAVQVRRLHDQDKSGWFVLLGFIPYVGGLILLVFMCIEGTRGPNRFGPDPKGSAGNIAEVFS